MASLVGLLFILPAPRVVLAERSLGRRGRYGGTKQTVACVRLSLLHTVVATGSLVV